MMQREHGDADGRGGEQEDADPALHQRIRPRRGPQAEIDQTAAGTDHGGAVAPHPLADPVVPPGGHGDAGDNSPDRPHQRRDPPPVERVLEEKRGGDEQRRYANREQALLPEPLLPVPTTRA